MRMFFVAREGYKPQNGELEQMSKAIEKFLKDSKKKISIGDNSPSILTIQNFDVVTIPDNVVERITPVFNEETGTYMIQINFQPLLAEDGEDA